MDRKIIFFDIDGTILDEETNKIPESALEAIRKLKENGHLAIINTGRTKVILPELIKNSGFNGYICGCGTYIECDGTKFYQIMNGICPFKRNCIRL